VALLCNKSWEQTSSWSRKAVKGLAAKANLQRVCSNQTLHELFNYCSSNVHSITLFYVQEEQILNYKKEVAERFDIAVAILGTQIYHCFNPLNSRAITTSVTFLSTFHSTPYNKKS
jgi:hypothetical protein